MIVLPLLLPLALLHNWSSPNYFLPLVQVILLNRLYNDTFKIISFTMFLNLVAEIYSPQVLFIEENAVSAIHRCPYFLFFFLHLSKYCCCDVTSLFLVLVLLVEVMEFFLILIPGRIFFSYRYLKFLLLSQEPSARTDFILILLLFFKIFSTSLSITFASSCTL